MSKLTEEWPGKLQPVDFRLGQGESALGEETKLVKH